MAKLEICTGSINSAIAAYKGGADRLELCDNLYEGGTTPSLGCLKIARKLIDIPLHVLIRPRGGDFLYNFNEFEIMKEDIRACKKIGIDGVVFGLLLKSGDVDENRTKELIDISRPMSITFHRAFDMTPNPLIALSIIKKMGVDRLLTSGQKKSAVEGMELIRELIIESGEDIVILPGGGLNTKNIYEFAIETGAKEYHATCRKSTFSEMEFKNPDVTMGGLSEIPEYNIRETDSREVSKIIQILQDIV